MISDYGKNYYIELKSLESYDPQKGYKSALRHSQRDYFDVLRKSGLNMLVIIEHRDTEKYTIFDLTMGSKQTMIKLGYEAFILTIAGRSDI